MAALVTSGAPVVVVGPFADAGCGQALES